MQFYSDKNREPLPYTLPDCEVFHLNGTETADYMLGGEEVEGGYFWHFCSPGCLPNSSPFGPYATQEAAIADCRKEYGESYCEPEIEGEMDEKERMEHLWSTLDTTVYIVLADYPQADGTYKQEDSGVECRFAPRENKWLCSDDQDGFSWVTESEKSSWALVEKKQEPES